MDTHLNIIDNRDRMTSIDRVNSLLNGKQIDRVPFFPFSLGFSAKNAGYPIGSVYSEPVRSFDAQLWTQQMYGYDQDPFFGSAVYGTSEFGGEVEFPNSDSIQSPRSKRYPVQSLDDIDKLRLPDPHTAGNLPKALEFSSIQESRGCFISLVVGGAFTTAGNICGVTNLCRWIIKEPEAVHRVVQLAADHILSAARLWVKVFGTERLLVQIWEPLAANSIISPRHFEEFVLPNQHKLHQEILGLGVKHILCHICGEQNKNLPLWSQVPMGAPGIVSLGQQVRLEDGIKHFGSNHIVAGNLSTSLVAGGTADEVYQAAKGCIQAGKDAPNGYILMTACETPPSTPPYNFYMLTKAINDFGFYD